MHPSRAMRVRLPPRAAAGYEVIVRPGALEQLPALLRVAAPAPQYAIIADATVADLAACAVCDTLVGSGLRAALIPFSAGEAHKTRETWAALTDALIEQGLGRDGCIIAVGGGVTGDLAGFVAATYMRGIALVHVPTTLLAMLDASVGGKTAVDTPAGKNLVGAWHQPRLVAIDPCVLVTLPDTELRSGLAEAVKHGAIADAAYLESIVTEAARLFAREADALTQLVRRSVAIKAAVVTADVEEAGRRQVLNFGHTLGHALEALSGYALPHGYAVAMGMVAEAEAGQTAGVTVPGTASALRDVLTALELPVRPPAGTDAAAVIALTRRDKKNRAGRTRYTLLSRIGEVARTPEGGWAFPLDESVVAGTLEGLSM